MASPNKNKRDKRVIAARNINWVSPICRNCGKIGHHYMPPGFGDGGGYICRASKASDMSAKTVAL